MDQAKQARQKLLKDRQTMNKEKVKEMEGLKQEALNGAFSTNIT